MTTPTISIDFDKACSRCGADGACQNGLCMKCNSKALIGKLKPSKPTTMSKSGLTNKRLDEIATQAQDDIKALIGESEKEILADYATVIDEANEDGKDKAPALRLGYMIEFNIENSVLTTKLSWSVKKTRSTETTMDADQIKLDLEKK